MSDDSESWLDEPVRWEDFHELRAAVVTLSGALRSLASEEAQNPLPPRMRQRLRDVAKQVDGHLTAIRERNPGRTRASDDDED